MAEHAILMMKLTGTKAGWIKGESEVKAHPEWIELTDWSWNLEQKQENGDVEPSIFSFSKLMDRATTAMLKSMAAGESLEAQILLEDTLGGYFQVEVKLGKVRITGYSFDTEIGDAQAEVAEKWKFNYETIDVAIKDDPSAGPKIVKLKRPAGASNEAPSGAADQIRKLVDKMSPGDLDKVWAQLKKDFVDKGRYGDDKTKSGGGDESAST